MKKYLWLLLFNSLILFSAGCKKCIECHRNIVCAICTVNTNQKTFSACSSEFNTNNLFFYFIDKKQSEDSFDCIFSIAGQETDKVCIPTYDAMDNYLAKMENHNDDFRQNVNNEMDCEH